MFNSTKRKIVFAYVIFFVLVFASAFLSNDLNLEKIVAESTDISDGWSVNGNPIELPYKTNDYFQATQKLPEVTNLEALIVKVRYDDVKVYIDGEEIYSTQPAIYFGRRTNAGCKEVVIPLKAEYSGKDIALQIKLHENLYGYSLSKTIISTPQNYIFNILMQNGIILLLVILFFATGIVEIVVSMGLKITYFTSRQKYTSEALFYAGWFSVDAAIWSFCDTRLPGILYGNMVSWSIVLYISFILMPIFFIALLNATENYENSIIRLLFIGFSLLGLLTVFAVWFGIIDWQESTIACHLMDAVDIIVAAYLAIKSAKKIETQKEKRIMYTGSGLFVLAGCLCIVMYVTNREGSYLSFFMGALLIYIITQVFLIINRVGLKAQEEKDYAVAQVYAYKDDLTGLGNRRFFYSELENISDTDVSEDFTIIYFDVNRLKYINDNLGHDAGDELLIGAAECITKSFINGTPCRMGGDEFAVLITATSVELEAMIRQFRITTQNWRGRKVDSMSVAVGYASLREHPDAGVGELRKLADDRMYSDKKKYYDETGYERRELM